MGRQPISQPVPCIRARACNGYTKLSLVTLVYLLPAADLMHPLGGWRS